MTNETTRRRKRRKQNLFTLILLGFLAFVLAIIIFIVANIIAISKDPITLDDIANSQLTIIYDKNGNEYEKIGNENGTDLSSYPVLIKNAVISVEDKRFYTHEGFDPIRITKAVFDTLKNRHFGAGGSTITQQLVKNVTGDKEVSINRKVREVFYAVAIEQKCSKEEILTRYLNIIYLGHGNFGMADATDMYFGKTPDKLTIAEAAFMAAIIKSPETYIKDLDRANERKNLVLGYMLEQEMISQEEYDKATNTYVKIELSSKSSKVHSWFTDSLISEFANQMVQDYGIEYDEAITAIYKGGYKIYSTVDPAVQSEMYSKYKALPSKIGDVQSGCVVLSKTGEVTAICGSTGKKTSNFRSNNKIFNRATQARRQPGSSLKPLAVYGPAFNENIINTLSSYEDKIVDYNGWAPKNYYSGCKGYMSIRNAVAISNNTIPVQIMNQMGSNIGISYLQAMHFQTEEQDNALTLALGAVYIGYTPMEMASGYQCLCNGGVWQEPIFYTKIIARDGSEVYNRSMQESKQIFSPETAYIITDLLKSVVEWESGTARNMAISGIEVAAKTGTTTQNKDKWICAYTPDYIITSWYGYDTPAEINVSSRLIQQTSRSILAKASTVNKAFARPETVNYYSVCKSSNLIATENCQETYVEVFDESKLPEVCNSCKGNIIDEAIDKIEENASNVFDYIDSFFNTDEPTDVPDEEDIEPESPDVEEASNAADEYPEQIAG